MLVLLIDNVDSFTFNLARYFEELGCDVRVSRNNAITLADVKAMAPQLIVISPGPCTPDESGVSLEIIAHLRGIIPIFGVCLGHQAIAQVLGAKVVRAAKVMHGKVSRVAHFGHKMFSDMPASFEVTRYHSLLVSRDRLPDDLLITSGTTDADSGEPDIMALAHKTEPLWGVQFHPESHLTQHGHRLLKNIIELAAAYPLSNAVSRRAIKPTA